LSFSATLNVKPRAKGRPRFGKGRSYTDAKTVEAEQAIRFQLLQLPNLPKFEGPITLNVLFCLKRPKSAKDRLHPVVQYDIDNLLKLLMDACNGLLWNDDGQVCRVAASKLYSANECIQIGIMEIAS
jgi:Holliday junction resolvase RusA-like endonuclease